ncbi:MAG: hypothetical protein ACR2L3_01140 [Actinomycetota bacterium]
MNRRIAVWCVLAALLAVPALAVALPSPETLGVKRETDPTKTTRTLVGGPLTVSANGATITTQALSDGRLYEFDVSGTWQYGTAAQQADMAYSTSDGWSSASKNPGARSLIIDGQKQSDTTVGYKAGHVYTVGYTGRGAGVPLRIFDENYGDNTGSLTVSIYAIAKITWPFANVTPLPDQLDLTSSVSVPPTPVPGVTVSPTSLGGTAPVNVAGVKSYRSNSPNGKPAWCLDITVGPDTTQVGCVADPAKIGPEANQTITTNGIPAVPVCQAPPCVFGGVQPTSVPIAGGIKKGSSLVLSLSWAGDDSHLWNYGTLNGTSITQRSNGWAPFDPTNAPERDWFTTNAGSLGATLSVCIKNPAPDNTCSSQQSFTAPGLGQLLEAMFNTRVNGQ